MGSLLVIDKAEQSALLEQLLHPDTASAALGLTPLPFAERHDRLEYFSRYTPERFLEWCKLYLPHAFTAAFGGHHQTMAQAFQVEGQTVEVLIPREYGKTTFMDAFDLYRMCYGRDQYIVRFEHDHDTAKKKGGLFAQELLHNPRIRQDYQLRAGRIWRPNAGELEVVNVNNPFATQKELFCRNIGVLNISRGTTYRFGRIDRAVLNDVVANMREAVSDSWNAFLLHLIKEDIGFAGGGKNANPVSIFFVTTIQAMNDISDRLRKDLTVMTYEYPALFGADEDVRGFVEFVENDMPNLRRMIDTIQGTPESGLTGVTVTDAHFEAYCAVNADYQAWFGKVSSSWPEKFTMGRHVRDMYRNGAQAWLQEKQHITADSVFQRFRFEWFQPYRELPDDGTLRYAMTVDWSGMPKEGNDPKAAFAAAYHPASGRIYTLGVWCDIASHEEAFEAIYALFWECFPFYTGAGVTVFMEDIISASGLGYAFFETLRRNKIVEAGGTPEAHRYWQKLPFVRFNAKQRGEKLLSINNLRILIGQRRFYYKPGHSAQNLMVQQFLNFQGVQTHKSLPLDRKIDIPDCVGMFAFKMVTPVTIDGETAAGLRALVAPPASLALTTDLRGRRRSLLG